MVNKTHKLNLFNAGLLWCEFWQKLRTFSTTKHGSLGWSRKLWKAVYWLVILHYRRMEQSGGKVPTIFKELRNIWKLYKVSSGFSFQITYFCIHLGFFQFPLANISYKIAGLYVRLLNHSFEKEEPFLIIHIHNCSTFKTVLLRLP